jgi:membrane peptidoglycan carboxypeptidase
VNSPYGQDAGRGQNTVNYAVDQKYGGSAGFQAGSTFKLFVLAAAMKQGIPLSTTIYAPPEIKLSGFRNCAGGDAGNWDVHNAGDSEQGRFDLVTGTWFSVNTFFAQLEQRTGLCDPVKIAESMGVRPATGGHISQFPSFTLGAANTFSPLDVAGAYATIAAHGQYCTPVAITKVTDQEGNRVDGPRSSCRQVLDPGLADTITTILHGVLTQTGATAVGVGEPGRPAAAKTGTAEKNAASDFAGFVPQMAAAVWVGDPRSPNRPLNFLTIGGRRYSYVYGATIAGPIWRDTLQAALQGKPVIPLPTPDQTYVHGVTKLVPDVSGLALATASHVLENAGFKVSVSVFPVDSEFPKDTVARTSPFAGAGAPPGSTVVIYLSTGRAPPAVPPSQPPSPGATSSPGQTPPTGPTCPPKKPGQKPPPHC